jgi:hypothetical protein
MATFKLSSSSSSIIKRNKNCPTQQTESGSKKKKKINKINKLPLLTTMVDIT